MNDVKPRLNEIYVKHTGQPLKKIEDAFERDMFLTAEMAKEFGRLSVSGRQKISVPLEDGFGFYAGLLGPFFEARAGSRQ